MYKRGRHKRVDLSLPSASTERIVSMVRATSETLIVSDDFRHRYMGQEMMRKFFSSDHDPKVSRDAAIEKWLQMEKRNLGTNIRLFTHSDDTPFEVYISNVLNRARRFIRRLIGPVPAVNWDFQTTNGASTRVNRSGVSSFLKLEGKPHCTLKALPVWLDAISETAFSDIEDFVYPHIVEGSMLFTVPKNADIDRVACKEPEINMVLQRSVGLALRKKLLKAGIDLHDQSNNRRMAAEAARSRKHATIDLSSASDTISHELVRQLLPTEWFDLLSSIRVECTSIPAGRNSFNHDLSMFSSMGNGFTFELETLIFWSIASAVQSLLKASGRILVYGDDIIVSTSTGKKLLPVLSYLGFIPNMKKTFLKGPFRESCGGHYYGQTDVTPVYFRSPPKTLMELISFLNQIRYWLHLYESDSIGSPVLDLWSSLQAYVPSFLKGGRSYESEGSLVSPHPLPRKELQQVFVKSRKDDQTSRKIRVVRPEVGAYRYALACAPFDQTEPVYYTTWVVRPSRQRHWYDRVWPLPDEVAG